MLHLFLGMSSDLQFLLFVKLLLNALFFNVWLPRERKRTIKGGVCWPFKFPEVTSVGGSGAYNNGMCNNGCPTLYLHLHYLSELPVTRPQIPDIWRTSSLLPILVPMVVCKLLQEHMHSCWAKNWNEPLLTIQVFHSKLQHFNRLQSSKIITSERFCQCNCCLGGERNSWCFILCSLLRIPPILYFGCLLVSVNFSLPYLCMPL